MQSEATWPALPLEAWRETCDTLHLCTQIVGKIRLALAPPEPEWAHVSLQVTSRGLTTTAMPLGDRTFAIDFDFVRHALDVVVSDGRALSIPLLSRSVAAFYELLMGALKALDIDVRIWTMPVEIPQPTRFTEDTIHASYDPLYAHRFWQILVQVDSILKEHRAPYRRRHTPVQFFWGTFDLAYTRFSGRPATPPNESLIMREAMDSEEICAGFWPGDERFPEPAFWCYVYPKPAGNIERANLVPPLAAWNGTLGEFVLTYEDARTSGSPRRAIRDFFASTYEHCASLANWDAAK